MRKNIYLQNRIYLRIDVCLMEKEKAGSRTMSTSGLERDTRLEPATPTLGRSCSTN